MSRSFISRLSRSLIPLSKNSNRASRPFSTTGIFRDDISSEDNVTVKVEKMEEFKIVCIGINRPAKRNCVNKVTAEKLYDAFSDFENDDNLNCAVLHGLGGNFSAGYDLGELAKIEKEDIANELASLMMDRGPMGPTRMEFTKPVVASISGYCVAGGLELALMCDLRVMEESAKTGVLNRRFGVPLIDGGSVRLPELIGLSRALDLIITGRMIEAKEAMQMGLVNRVAKVGTAYGQSVQLATEIARLPQECLRADRASAIHATFASKSLEGSLQFESDNAIHVISKESLVGARKFVKEGLGRQGKFNVNPVEKESWEIEHEAMKVQANEADKEKMS